MNAMEKLARGADDDLEVVDDWFDRFFNCGIETCDADREALVKLTRARRKIAKLMRLAEQQGVKF